MVPILRMELKVAIKQTTIQQMVLDQQMELQIIQMVRDQQMELQILQMEQIFPIRQTPRIQPGLPIVQIPLMEQIQQIQQILQGPQMELMLQTALALKITLIAQDKTLHRPMERLQITVLIQMAQDLKIVQIKRLQPITALITAPTAHNSRRISQQTFLLALVRLNSVDYANL